MTQSQRQILDTTDNLPTSHTNRVPKATRGARSSWPGRILTGIPLLFLAFDASIKVLELAPAAEGTQQLGYPVDSLFTIGVLELLCVIVCLVPRTAILGAVLCTGYLGGAVATHVRVDSPLFSHTLFPIYVAALLWAGLWLNDSNLRRVLPLRGDQQRPESH